MMNRAIRRHAAQFEIIWSECTAKKMVIRDIGENCRSVTNDAENVVEELQSKGLRPGVQLLYYDSMGNLDEIVHDEKGFVGFKVLPRCQALKQ